MKIAAVVAAAGMSSRMKAFKPMLELAGSSIIKKTLDTLREADIRHITVVVGHRAKELSKHLAGQQVRIVENSNYRQGDMLESVQLGLSAAGDCDVLLLLPGDVPLFSADTVRLLCARLAAGNCDFVSPTSRGKKGHPIAVAGRMAAPLLAYHGNGGLKAALEQSGGIHCTVAVDDPGILLDADQPQDYERLQAYAASMTPRAPIVPQVTLMLARQEPFWNEQLVRLLLSVGETGSLHKSCELVGVSYSKGWGSVKQAQQALGVPLLNASAGGAGGGGSTLTAEAAVLVESYLAMQEELRTLTADLFGKHFGELFAPENRP